MKGRAIALGRRNRWALSFADLSLLMLGFFVLLHASNGREQEVVSGVAQEFGAPARQSDQLAAAALFQQGEALLSADGQARIARIASQYRAGKGIIEVRSVGLDPASNRYDNWDLAAARLSAVARALTAQGIMRERIVIRGLDEQSESKAGQQILVRQR